MRRRTKEEILHAREEDWRFLAVAGFTGHRACSKCFQVAHCRGKTYERQRCKPCHLGG